MTMSRAQIALIHVAKKDRGLSDDEYRAALIQIAGVTSSVELDTEGFDAMMGFFVWLGFAPTKAKGPNFGARDGMASFAQIEFIRHLWAEITRNAYAGEDELNKWLLSKFKVSSLRFLKKDAAQKAITSLKSWKARLRAQGSKAA